MVQEPGGQDAERSAGVQLAQLLRRWWEEAASPAGGTRPTQQALAARLGVDQTTLSRYLNPKHLSTAPLRVVDALHAQLHAPATELERARELCRAAMRENSRQRATDAGEHPAPTPDADTSAETPAPDATPALTTGRGPSARPRPRWLGPALAAAALVSAFMAGAAVHAWFFTEDRTAEAATGATGSVGVSEAPYKWPLLRVDQQDQFTRARVLQYLLNAQGYKVRTDGVFRQDTQDAVMHFQRKVGLPADGKAGDQTWPELVEEVGPGSATLKVRAVQELLNNVGLGGTAVTGRFSAETAQDVRHFQRTWGLPVTGRVDEGTWLVLLVKQLAPVKAPDYQRASVSP
ncbi:peptidoglycan-binding protein [Streptomyces sp. NPDC059861]|uniref:peptidoglycan-binding protein n=1 Tax=Streptomyces sp. NPDC059861 TaxID=3346974 RepID=UPI00364E3417